MPPCSTAMAEYAFWPSRIDGCVYCGGDANTWDHLHPLVINRMPSGIVPSTFEMLPCAAGATRPRARRLGGRTWTAWRPAAAMPSTTAPGSTSRAVRRLEGRARTEVGRSCSRGHLRELSAVVGDCHQFMQKLVNRAVSRIHGANACCFTHNDTVLDWSSIEAQLRHQ